MRFWRCYLSSFLSPCAEQQPLICSFAFTKLICNWHKVSCCHDGVQWAARTPPPLPGLYRPVTSDWTEGVSSNPCFAALFCNGWHVKGLLFPSLILSQTQTGEDNRMTVFLFFKKKSKETVVAAGNKKGLQSRKCTKFSAEKRNRNC